jgi:multiple sugar transport system permease protein
MPNMHIYNRSFSGNQSNSAAALASVIAMIVMAVAYAVQSGSMKEQMR